jgi:hypothetical protein
MSRRLFVALTLVAGVGVSPVWADNTTAPNARELFLGQAQVQSYASVASRWYKAHLVAGRSYQLMVWAPYTDPSQAIISLDSAFFQDDGVTTATAVHTGDVEPRMEASNNNDAERIIPALTATHRLRVTNASASGYTVNVMLVETTMFSPWYFAASGYDGYVTIRNNMSQSVTAIVTVYAANGTVIGSTSVVIPGNGNTFVQVSSLGATASGSVQIAHNGSLNGVSANLTTLSATTGLSFDAAFTARMSWGMTIAF